MNRARLLPLVVLIIASTLILPAFAIPWSAPTFPFYASLNEHGAMYFSVGFSATNGSWIGGLLCFTGFNYASGGVFPNTVGFAAQNDTTMTLLEAAPADHVLFQSSSVGALRNVTMWFPGGITVVNVTTASAWTWDNATSLLEMTTPLGLANINISFVAGGGMPIYFLIPQWFIDQGGNILTGGLIPNIFTEMMRIFMAFAVWFLVSVDAIVDLVGSIMLIIFFVGGSVIYWFGAFVTTWIRLFTIIGQLFDGTIGPMNIISQFRVADWISVVPVFSTMMWYDSIRHRRYKTGESSVRILVGDIQIILYLVEQVWNWVWLIFNFIWGILMTFASLLWGLMP